MNYTVSDADKNQAKAPHDILLFNLITNHILVFVGLLGMAKSFPAVMLVTPAISIVVMSYLLIGARRAMRSRSWYVAMHWQLCAKRTRSFLIMIGVLALVVVGLLVSVGGDAGQLRPGHYAIGGVTMLPTLLTVLVLIVMESDAQHKAKSGIVPEWLAAKFPPPAEVRVEVAVDELRAAA